VSMEVSSFMDIIFRSSHVASIGLSPNGNPTFQKEFDAVSIGIPLEFRFEAVNRANETWVLSDLDATLVVQIAGAHSKTLAVGHLTEVFQPATLPMTLPRQFQTACSSRALAEYEKFRAGGSVRFRCEVRGKISSLMYANNRGWLGEPTPVFGFVDVEFSNESWNRALRSCGASLSVLLEVPVSFSTKPDNAGLRALSDAVEAFERGGSTAWKDSIGHIRPFLEDWKKREPRVGDEPKDGSAADRNWKLLNLRDALYKCCHFWVHEEKSACTRKDALVALATFASLLDSFEA
jgi:hypothetical protein